MADISSSGTWTDLGSIFDGARNTPHLNDVPLDVFRNGASDEVKQFIELFMVGNTCTYWEAVHAIRAFLTSEINMNVPNLQSA